MRYLADFRWFGVAIVLAWAAVLLVTQVSNRPLNDEYAVPHAPYVAVSKQAMPFDWKYSLHQVEKAIAVVIRLQDSTR